MKPIVKGNAMKKKPVKQESKKMEAKEVKTPKKTTKPVKKK